MQRSERTRVLGPRSADWLFWVFPPIKVVTDNVVLASNKIAFNALQPTAVSGILAAAWPEDRATLASDPSASQAPYGTGRFPLRDGLLYVLPLAQSDKRTFVKSLNLTCPNHFYWTRT